MKVRHTFSVEELVLEKFRRYIFDKYGTTKGFMSEEMQTAMRIYLIAVTQDPDLIDDEEERLEFINNMKNLE